MSWSRWAWSSAFEKTAGRTSARALLYSVTAILAVVTLLFPALVLIEHMRTSKVAEGPPDRS